ncbi:hypothetical protein NM688_g1629 [Phlebia brevispora]|uniref:Uncharacterized protein n=1 Tax=Phlebia brevispora TaxID=194682 RepID=A0ACC1TAS5_9APHY|nr:hypothetical protein NM688_g1629 [Phlebia brevispora]
MSPYTLILKIPFLVLNSLCAHMAFTAPVSIPHPEEQKKYEAVNDVFYETGPFTVLDAAYTIKLILHVLNALEALVIILTAFPNLLDVVSMSLAEVRLAGLFITPRLGITSTFITGCIIMYPGSILRYTAYYHLGQFFTFQLAVRKDHKLITSGPYSIVRHPSYTGAIAFMAGIAICQLGPGSLWWESGMGKGVTGFIAATLYVATLVYIGVSAVLRTAQEDKILRGQFGEQWDIDCKELAAGTFLNYGLLALVYIHCILGEKLHSVMSTMMQEFLDYAGPEPTSEYAYAPRSQAYSEFHTEHVSYAMQHCAPVWRMDSPLHSYGTVFTSPVPPPHPEEQEKFVPSHGAYEKGRFTFLDAAKIMKPIFHILNFVEALVILITAYPNLLDTLPTPYSDVIARLLIVPITSCIADALKACVRTAINDLPPRLQLRTRHIRPRQSFTQWLTKDEGERPAKEALWAWYRSSHTARQVCSRSNGLGRENDLLTAASDTIAAMKARAEHLDADMDLLKAAFSEISRLSAEVAIETHRSASEALRES